MKKKKSFGKLNIKKTTVSNFEEAKGGGTTFPNCTGANNCTGNCSYAPDVCMGTLQEYCTAGQDCTRFWQCDLGTHPAV